jgi:hypothetical protein
MVVATQGEFLMNNLTIALLGGVSATALVAVSASAGTMNHMTGQHLTALHAGKVINKSKMHNAGTTKIYSTISVFTYGTTSSNKQELLGTFYKYNNSGDLCSVPKKSKIKAAKKSVYGKVATGSITYYEGCPGAQPTFYGDYWTNKSGKSGQTDTFQSVLTANFTNGGAKYKGQLTLDVNVFIE